MTVSLKKFEFVVDCDIPMLNVLPVADPCDTVNDKLLPLVYVLENVLVVPTLLEVVNPFLLRDPGGSYKIEFMRNFGGTAADIVTQKDGGVGEFNPT